jgi:hypothetical protein
LVGKLLAWSVVLMALGYGLSCATRLYDVPAGEQAPSLDKFAASPVVIPAERVRGRDLGSLLAEPPFVSPPGPSERQLNYWMMGQRSGSLSYQVFAAGLSLAVFVLFYLVCDRLGWRVGFFRTLGTNALAAYVLADLVEARVAPFVPREAPWWHVTAGFAVFFAATYLLLRLLERMGIRFRF